MTAIIAAVLFAPTGLLFTKLDSDIRALDSDIKALSVKVDVGLLCLGLLSAGTLAATLLRR